ncbi:MAG TPA: hypothetical protein VLK36_02685 [Gaiellaceae bacterium]|nr:hypothetical protein [Gaiellaceae bacterium]
MQRAVAHFYSVEQEATAAGYQLGPATGLARSSHGSTVKTESPPLAALPPEAGLVQAFAFDPRSPEIVYVLANGFSADSSHVFKSTDAGAHWQTMAARGGGWVGANEALTADPQHSGTLYAGTESAVYKTVDGGRSWRPSKRGLLAPPRPTYEFNRDLGWVRALAVDPADTNVVYAGSDRVSKSSDGGSSWETVFPPHATRYPAENVSALAIAPSRPEAIYAITGEFANPSATPANGRFSIYRSTDAGATWQATTTVRASVTVTALAVDPRYPTTVYAAIGANLLKTTNGGQTWQPIAHGLPIGDPHGSCHCVSRVGGVRALAVDPRRSGTVFAALTQGGIYKTSNGGQTWIRATGRLLYQPTVAVDPAHPATIYAAGQGVTGDGPHVLRSTSSGRAWVTAP